MDAATTKSRYQRQIAFAPFGETGQKRLGLSGAVLIGCGALGSAVADLLVRAGIGSLRIIDRDFVEITNLQRQTLFDEQDVAENLPKAEAARRKLRRINSGVEVDAVIADVRFDNIESMVRDADVILDGLDNFETRYLINDAAIKLEIPWIYAGAVGSHGASMPILPGRTACLRCLWPESPPAGSVETCETAGVLGPVVTAVAALEAAMCIKLLAGALKAPDCALRSIDVWTGRSTSISTAQAPDPECPCCAKRQFAYLCGDVQSQTSVLCGRNAVQISPSRSSQKVIDLPRFASSLPPVAKPLHNRFLVRFQAGNCEVTLFPDGRAIISGTPDPLVARRVYSEWIGT